MKKGLGLSILISICLLICGCSEDRFAIEKKYWRIKKKAENIFKNPAGSPPNELENVVGLYKNFITQHPKNLLTIESEFNIAKLYIAKEEYTKARLQLNNLLRKYHKSQIICSEAIFLIGHSYQLQNKWQAALEQYKKVIKDYPLTKKGFELPVYIGAYYKIKFQPDKMMQAFDEAILHYHSLANKYPQSRLALKCYDIIASLYTETQKWNEVIQTLETIVDKFKTKIPTEQIVFKIAVIYKSELKDTPKAKQTLERIINEYPKSKMINTVKILLKNIDKESKK